jgi:Zn-dependent peptidase ImmA (M78 family)/transcriptional regulator with XRE-family HTH domain
MPNVKPDILQWARETAGFALEEAAKALDLAPERLKALEAGDSAPTRPQLIKMMKRYRRSLLTFYLEKPPQKADRGEDFRTLPKDRSIAADALLDALLRDLRVRQSITRETLLDDEDFEPVKFVGTARRENGVATLVTDIRTTLSISCDGFRAQKSADEAFNYLRSAAHRAGVFVLLVGDLGSYHSAIPVQAFRGFAIADPVAPFVVINDRDAKVAWSFTLLHELAHLWLGTTGVSGPDADRDIEQFCNDVAGELLIPQQELAALDVPAKLPIDEAIGVIAAFARERKVSRQMVAYKLYRAGRIDWDRWSAINNRIREIWVQEQQRKKAQEKARDDEGGPNYYIVRRHRLGDALLSLVGRSVDSGLLPPSKAARVLGVRPRSVFPLLAG